MKTILLKAVNIFFMIMFWVSFIAFCAPYALEMRGEFAFNISMSGLLGTMVFLTAWAFSLDCWFKNK